MQKTLFLKISWSGTENYCFTLKQAWYCRLYVYEAAERIFAGASPNLTQQLLDRSVRQHFGSRSSIICGNRYTKVGNESTKATALYLACKHLPAPCLSSPGERAGMLVCAVKSLEKIGDKRRLNECYKLMKTISNGVIN